MGILSVALSHLGQDGPINTCLSSVQRWSREAGLPTVGGGTASVGVWRTALLSGDRGRTGGWTYHFGMDGVAVGDVLDWAVPIHHVSVVDAIENGRIRSIGSGGPSGLIARQPTGGGFNAPGNFRPYARPPGMAVAGVNAVAIAAATLKRKRRTMQLIRDTSPTYWLTTEEAMWVVPDQAHAEMVDRYLNLNPFRSDIEYVVGLMQTAPWFRFGASASGNQVDQAALASVVNNAIAAALGGVVPDSQIAQAQEAIVAAIPSDFAVVSRAIPVDPADDAQQAPPIISRPVL